jgi:DNA-binding response OmpR family regulator
MKVLVVNCSQDLIQDISFILKIRWPNLCLVHSDETGESLELIHREQPDIVMFHLSQQCLETPPPNCFDLINQLRSFSDVPLIVISQSNNVLNKVKALDMGADDWITPFFVPMEFIAKVNAILRRCSPNSDIASFFLDGKLSINYDTHQVCISGKPVKLTPMQYKLLCHLVKNQGRVCSTTELLQHVWGPNYSDDRELLKLSVYRLRSRIEEDPSNPEIIFNERGMGYVIKASSQSK